MNGLDSFLKIPNFAEEINRNLGLNSGILNMIQTQEKLKRQFQPFYNLQRQLNKTYGISEILRASEIATIQGIGQSFAWQSKFRLPAETMSALTLIQKQQEQLFNRPALKQLVQSNIVAAQMSSLQVALSGISGSIARLAASQQEWELINEFESINQTAIELTENSSPDAFLTEHESAAFSQLIERIIAFVQRNKKFAKYSLIFIQVIIAIAALHQYYDFLTKPAAATKADLAKFERKITVEIHAKLIEQKEYRVIDRMCKVRLKPKSGSLVLTVLPKNLDVVVLQFRHQWVYISFIGESDNITESGWVLKKYLRKP